MYFQAMSMRKKQTPLCAFIFSLLMLMRAPFAQASDIAAKPVALGFSVVHVFPHDITHFTEGLIWHDGKIYESTGLYGHSAIYESEIASGRILRSRALDSRKFGEGLTFSKGHLVQLTWKENTGLIWDLAFNPVAQFHYETEGWGLSTYGHGLVMSDGSATLRFLSADDFHVVRSITVHNGAHPIDMVNELETAHGYIYANIWTTNLIVVISPSDGKIVAWLDLTSLENQLVKPASWNEQEDVLNGIAFDPDSGTFFVTGKCWPSLFEIRIDPLPPRDIQPGNGVATPQ